MATGIDDMRRRQNYAAAAGHSYQPLYTHPAPHAQVLRNQQYLHTSNNMMHHGYGHGHGPGDGGMNNLASAMGAMNMQTQGYGQASDRGLHSQAASDYGNVSMPQSPAMYYPSGQAMVYAGAQPVVSTAAAGNAGMYAPVNSYVHQQAYAPYAPYAQPQHTSEHGQNGHGWNSRISSETSGMPTLITPRRGSTASTEEHLPGTPYTGATTQGSYGNGVAVFDRSPSGPYAGNSSSPSPFLGNFATPHAGKNAHLSSTPLSLQLMVAQDPPIPRAIPAPSSPMKPLDRCLENKNGETNVYIRGLLPETTDDMLRNWGSRFGDIVSSKSIIDHRTNLCKGFGFIKYHNFDDAENCIRGFHYLGYEVSFARESFYAKLKKFSDECNTNLYVSNIPKKMNEHELSEVFVPYNVCSARILRDNEGNGRGVGFARFESRDICAEVIEKFNNHTCVREGDEEEYVIQIRFADTQEQKLLKQQTAAARQFRAAEFEYGCMQAGRGHLLHPERDGSLSPGASSTGQSHNWDQYTGSGANSSVRSTYLLSRPAPPALKAECEGVKIEAGPSSPSSEPEVKVDSGADILANTPPSSPDHVQVDTHKPTKTIEA